MLRASPYLAIAEASPHVARPPARPTSIGRIGRPSPARPGGRAAGPTDRQRAGVRRPRVQAGRASWPFAKPFAAIIPVTPSTRFGLPKLWRRAAARPATPTTPSWSSDAREDGERTQLRDHAARIKGGEGGVQRVFVWWLVS